MHRYRLKYGDSGGYVVKDWGYVGTHPVVFRSDSKSECIAKAQELNGFTPIDGSESTYGRQIAEAKSRVGR
jgi:hypothetical protein